MANQPNDPLYNLSYMKSNDFVVAKYKASLLENQIMAIALSRMEVNAKDKDFPLEAKLYPGELRRLFNNSKHIYRDLKALAKTMPGRTMFLEDEKGNFKSFSIVPNADYEDGVFTIKFNNEIRDHVYGLEGKYTTLALSMMTSFKSNAAFRLYEVLMKDAYRIGKKKDAYVEVEYNLSELRFIMGLANGDDTYVKNAMARMGNNVDWDELYNRLDKNDKTYEQWRDFQKKILIPAQDELKKRSDICFEYTPLRECRKINRIRFKIFKNTPTEIEGPQEKKKILDNIAMPYRQLELPMDMNLDLYQDYSGHNSLAKEDLDLLINKAGGDVNLVRQAIEEADKQDHIYNYVGWIIKYIERGGYKENIETVRGSKETAEAYNEILDTYEKNKVDIAQRTWEKLKDSVMFISFEEEIKAAGMDIEQMEMIYSPAELVRFYTDFKSGKGINI